MSKPDVLKTPPGFKPLDQTTPHYLGSPGRGHPHLTPEPIPFPSSTNRTSPKSTINVFSRNGGLGTSVVVTEQQPSISTNYQDQKVYDQHENNINAEKIMAEQKALAEKQYRAEQIALSEKNERAARAAVEQQQRGVPFSEEKPQVPTNKLLNSQMPPSKDMTAEELTRTTDRLTADLPEQRKTIADTMVPLNDPHRQNMVTKDGLKLSKNEVGNVVANKMTMHGPSAPTNQMSSIPQKSTYTSSEILNLASTTHALTTAKTQVSGKTTNAPPGVLPMNLYAGVQPGLMPTAYQQALHGYSYDDLLQMQRVPMPPYTYDVSMFQAAAAAGQTSAREGIQGYQGNDSKFSRGADESSPVNIPQGTAHVAPGNLPTQQQAAYMNAAGQLPYGYAYTYQPNVLPQGGVYPAFTTQGTMYQMQGKGTQYQTQFQSAQQQQGHYNSSKFSGTTSHEFSKGNFHHTNPSVPLAAHPTKGTQQNTSSSSSSTTIQSGPRSAYSNKPQYTQDGKGYPSNSPTSLTAQQQHGMHMQHNPSPHMNHYLHVQPHTNLMTHSGTNLMTHTQQISASHIGHQPQMDSHRSQVHQMPFSANQQKRGDTKGSYGGSYWLGNR